MSTWKQYNCGQPSRETRAMVTDRPPITAPDPSSFHYCYLCWRCTFFSDGWAKGEVEDYGWRKGYHTVMWGTSMHGGKPWTDITEGHSRSPKIIIWKTLGSSPTGARWTVTITTMVFFFQPCIVTVYRYWHIYPDTNAWTDSLPHLLQWRFLTTVFSTRIEGSSWTVRPETSQYEKIRLLHLFGLLVIKYFVNTAVGMIIANTEVHL